MMRFSTVCTAQIDLKACLYGILCVIEFISEQDVEMGELGGERRASRRGKHIISHAYPPSPRDHVIAGFCDGSGISRGFPT